MPMTGIIKSSQLCLTQGGLICSTRTIDTAGRDMSTTGISMDASAVQQPILLLTATTEPLEAEVEVEELGAQKVLTTTRRNTTSPFTIPRAFRTGGSLPSITRTRSITTRTVLPSTIRDPQSLGRTTETIRRQRTPDRKRRVKATRRRATMIKASPNTRASRQWILPI